MGRKGMNTSDQGSLDRVKAKIRQALKSGSEVVLLTSFDRRQLYRMAGLKLEPKDRHSMMMKLDIAQQLVKSIDYSHRAKEASKSRRRLTATPPTNHDTV